MVEDGVGAGRAPLGLRLPREGVFTGHFPPSPPQLTSGTFIPKCSRKKLLPFPLQIQVRRLVGGEGGGLGEGCLALRAPPFPPSLSPGLCSEACLFRLARCPSPKLLRAHSAEKRRPVPTFQKVPLPSGPAPAHSLGDLKNSWPGRGLVTRFFQMSKKAPDPSGNGAHGLKQVRVRGIWEDTQEKAWSFRLSHTDALSCVPPLGAPEPVGPARPREPPPSKLWRPELRLFPAAPPLWPPAGARYPPPQPQPQRGQPGDWALTQDSCHSEQIQMNAGATGTPQHPVHWLTQKETR